MSKTAQSGRHAFYLTHEQVSALYLFLFHGRHGGRERPEVRPAFGWMEGPLVAIEEALSPVHSALHDRTFNAMNRQFFGNDSRFVPEAPMPESIIPADPLSPKAPK